MLTQFRQAPGNTAYREPNISSGVSHLCFLRCPNAIVGRVISIIVQSFNRRFGRSLSHIVRKRKKALLPLAANLNSPASVLVEIGVFRIGTSCNHIRPRIVNRVFSGCVSVLEKSRACRFILRTPTRHVISRPKLVDPDILFSPALASALHNPPVSIARVGSKLLNYFELSKNESYSRYSGRHNIGLFSVVFSGGRPAVTGAHCEILSELSGGVN